MKQGFTFSLSNAEDTWKQVQSLKEVVPASTLPPQGGSGLVLCALPHPHHSLQAMVCFPIPEMNEAGRWGAVRHGPLTTSTEADRRLCF